MDSEDEPLLLQAMWDFSEYEEQDEEEEKEACDEGVEVIRGEPICRGLWWVVGWIYTRPWASGVVLVVGFLLPLTLSAYMFIYCEPLDIDLSYSAFEVRSHSSAERFDALTIALKSQLGSWDRHRRDAEGFDFDSNALRDILLLQTQALWRMELVFVAQGDKDNNIFTPERLHTIHHVERLLMQHPQFQQFCWKPLEVLRDLPLGPSYCSPPSSLLSYLFPSERGGKIYFDGMGSDSGQPSFLPPPQRDPFWSTTAILLLCTRQAPGAETKIQGLCGSVC